LNKLHRLGLDNSLVSWEKSYYDDRMIDELFKYDKNEEFAKLMKETSRYIDVEDLINVSGYGFEDRDMYLKTYISLVTESIFFQVDVNFPTGFISEKIWKPVGQCQPFILAGPANSLKYIKERFGFKSFHPFIDESYDNISDDMERLNMILIEIEKFSNKSKSSKVEFLKDVKDICVFNQTLFLQCSNSKKEIEKVYDFLHRPSALKIL
jgi:hypothetical protein